MALKENLSLRSSYDYLAAKSGQIFAVEIKTLDTLASKVPVLEKYLTAQTKHARAGFVLGSGLDVYSNTPLSTFSQRLNRAVELEVGAAEDLAISFIEIRKAVSLPAKMS